MTCADIRTLGEDSLTEFGRKIAAIPQHVCGAFHDEARALEISILTVYKAVVLATKREDDLQNVSKLWECMVEICDAAADQLGRLVKEHPACGAEVYYDRLFDLRNKCQRLKNLHA